MPQASVQVTVEGTARVTVKILVLDDAAKGTLETSMREKFGTSTTANEFLIRQNVIGVTVVDNPVITGEGGGDGGAGGIIAGVVIAIIVVIAIAVGLCAFARDAAAAAARRRPARRRSPAASRLAGARPSTRRAGAPTASTRTPAKLQWENARRRRRPAPPSLPAGWPERGRPVERQDVLCQLDDGQTSWEMPR